MTHAELYAAEVRAYKAYVRAARGDHAKGEPAPTARLVRRLRAEWHTALDECRAAGVDPVALARVTESKVVKRGSKTG